MTVQQERYETFGVIISIASEFAKEKMVHKTCEDERRQSDVHWHKVSDISSKLLMC